MIRAKYKVINVGSFFFPWVHEEGVLKYIIKKLKKRIKNIYGKSIISLERNKLSEKNS